MGAIETLLIDIINGSSELKPDEVVNLKRKVKALGISDTVGRNVSSLQQLKKRLNFLPTVVWNRFINERYRYEKNYNSRIKSLLRQR